MRKFLLFLISLVAGAGLFAWVLEFVGLESIRDAFLVFTGWHGLIMLLLTAMIMAIGIWKWQEILEGEKVKISCKDLIFPYLAGFSVMFLAPVLIWGSEIFRGYYIKEKKGVPWVKGLASVIIDRIMEWTLNALIIIGGSLFFFYRIAPPPQKIGIFFGLVFLVFVAAMGYFYLKVLKKESILEVILKIFGLRNVKEKETFLEVENEIFSFFKARNKYMWMAFFLAFLRVAAMGLRVWFLILFLEKDIGILPTIAVLGFSYLAVLIPIPASLGSHEALQTFSFSALGLGVPTAAAFTLVLRGAEMAFALGGLAIFFSQGMEFLKNIILRKVENFAIKKE